METQYTPTKLVNGYQPPGWQQSTAVNCPHPGQYSIEKTTAGFIIRRGGNPLIDRPFEIKDGARIKNRQDSELLKNYNIQLAINRDSLLGACLWAHLPTVPLLTPLELDKIKDRGEYPFFTCTFALSKEQIQSPPLSYKEGTNHLSLDPISEIGKIPINDMKGAASNYVDNMQTVIDGIVFPSTQSMAFAKVEFIYSFKFPDGLTTLECLYKVDDDSTTSAEDDSTTSDEEQGLDGPKVKVPTLETKVDSLKDPVTYTNKRPRKYNSQEPSSGGTR